MGLAAGQARLLTITGRKSDCEFESMRLSHQKIALARQLADLSNEYQNSLTQTKLVYDYYGKGDTSMQLSYGILMSPSALNNYMPKPITDSMGRVTLNSKLAAAAAAAGIPQEGLGTLPSETTRNNFVQGLEDNGVITQTMSERIQGLPYNQAAGLGGGATVAIMTEKLTLDELVDKLQDYSVSPMNSYYNEEYVGEINMYCKNQDGEEEIYNIGDKQHPGDDKDGDNFHANTNQTVTLKDILEGDYILLSTTNDVRHGDDATNYSIGHTGGAIDAIANSEFWETMFSTIEELLNTGDAFTQKALEYARNQIEYMVTFQGVRKDDKGSPGCEAPEKGQYCNDEDHKNFAEWISWYNENEGDGTVINKAYDLATSSHDGFIGLNGVFNCDSGHDDDSDISAISVNLSNVFKAYLTYFTDFMNGIAKTAPDGQEVYDVTKTVQTSHLVDGSTTFNVKVGSEVSSDDLGQATFYDALFNQICLHGWTENDNVNDNEYLQQMLQNGMLFVSSLKDDGYYYQGNYATDIYIKEITDDKFIAQAEAKYNTEKAKLNAKEETIDMKMKNLDTEISALTTEYDTVKNTISKQIEKAFKRYSA